MAVYRCLKRCVTTFICHQDMTFFTGLCFADFIWEKFLNEPVGLLILEVALLYMALFCVMQITLDMLL